MNGETGITGCDILEIFYNGDQKNKFYVGSKNEFGQKAAYLFYLLL